MDEHWHEYASLTLRSSIELPELRPAVPTKSAVSMRLDPAIVQRASEHEWTQRWPETGDEWLLLRSTSAGFVARFVGSADFFVEEGVIRVAPVAEAADDTLRHLLLDHVLPRYLAWTDHLVLHAAAVRIPDGRVVLFMGESGEGKSTLAAGFAAHSGGEILADDCVLLETTADATLAIPTYGGLRLWPDSLAALHPEHVARAPAVASYTKKRRVIPVDESAPGARSIAAILELTVWDDTETTWFETLDRATACSALMRNAFQGVADSRRGLRLVARASEVARRVPISAFDYPRRYDWLARASEAILEHLPPIPSRDLPPSRPDHETRP